MIQPYLSVELVMKVYLMQGLAHVLTASSLHCRNW